jgi:DNA processing protein
VKYDGYFEPTSAAVRNAVRGTLGGMQNTLSEDAQAAWLRLSLQPGIGAIHAHRLLQTFDEPSALYQASYATLRTLLSAPLAAQLAQPLSPDAARYIERALRWARESGQALVTPAHPFYPVRLRQMPDAPLVLYARGALRRLEQDALAIVGARNATPDGLDHAQAFALYLAQQGFAIVSGLAHGIDAAAHRGALKAGQEHGGTIAVLGTGADVVYPASHRTLADSILSADGLILSEFELGRPALAAHFPKRNRIVAGLSLGVVVVEAALKSGSLITARLAVDMGREVFAIPGSIHSPLSRGPHTLIKQGAKLVESGADILSELQPRARCERNLADTSTPEVLQNELPLTGQGNRFAVNTMTVTNAAAVLGQAQALIPSSPIWNAIGYDPITEEQLQRRTGLAPAQLQVELFTLELEGHIERRGHGQFVRAHARTAC